MDMTRRAVYMALSLAAGVSALNAQHPAICTNTSSPALACSMLAHSYPNITHFQNDTVYVEDNTDFWSTSSSLYPACIFAPENAEQMSAAVQILTYTCTPFAMKGGGHMPISNAANINSTGVLLASSGLLNLELSESGDALSTGPGNHWVDVYDFLEPYGLTILGGRLGVVGIPGFLMGGGISFFSYEYGWAASSVVSFECVLASGKIVTASPNGSYSDLYWALRGGGNSFAIVTSIQLKTYEVPAVTVGQVSYGYANGSDIGDLYMDYVCDYAFNGSADPKAALIPLLSYSAGTRTFGSYLFYNGNDTTPTAFTNFTGSVLPIEENTFSYRSMAEWCVEADAPFAEAYGYRERFHIVAFPASREGMQIVHDTIFSVAATVNVTGFSVTLAFMPITERYLTAGHSVFGMGDPMGVDPSQAPYFWVEESMTWPDGTGDAAVDAFVETANAQIEERFEESGLKMSPYLYLNDADETQPVFEGYPDCNVQRLKKIRAKYDPGMVYTNLMPGGWKIEHTAHGINTTIGCSL